MLKNKLKFSKFSNFEKILIFLNFKFDILSIKYRIFEFNLFLKICEFKKKNKLILIKMLGVSVLFNELKINFNILLLIYINN